MITVKSFTFNAYQENTYLLYDETRQTVIIDPGMYSGEEQNEVLHFIASQKLLPVLLLNTHCHIDHVLGNKWTYDTYGLLPQFHERELALLHAVPSYAPEMGFRYELSPQPDILLKEEGLIEFGTSRLELIFAPGHSPGHLCFYSRDDNFLIGGDVLFLQSIGRTDLPGGNYETLIHSIRNNIFSLPDECIVHPGHGPETSIGYEKKYNPFLNN